MVASFGYVSPTADDYLSILVVISIWYVVMYAVAVAWRGPLSFTGANGPLDEYLYYPFLISLVVLGVGVARYVHLKVRS